MIKFLKTSTYGKSDKKTQLSQRTAPIKKIKKERLRRRFLSKMWTYGAPVPKPESAYYVTGTFLDPDPLTYTEICVMEEERREIWRQRQSYVNPWTAGRKKFAPKRKFIPKRVSKVQDKFEPQAGADFASIQKSFQDIFKYANIDYTDELMIQLEGIVALFFTLQGCKDYVAMSSAIFLYIRKFFDKSITTHVMDYINELFENTPQSGTEDDDKRKDSWVELIKNLRDNWVAARDSHLFAHFSKLLGLIVTLNLCTASDLTFNIKEYRIWEPDMKIVHGSATDIFDAALCTVAYFVEHVSLCWKHKSLRPFLINNKEAAELDEEYCRIISWWDLVKNGNLMRIAKISDQEFDRRLESLTTKIGNMMGGLKSFDKKLMHDKYMHLLKIKNDFVTKKMGSGVRRAPYCIELFGLSSQGKTTFGEQIIQALLTSADLPTGKEYQASYNAGDKFMSNWSTDKLVLLIDDMANEKSNFVERPPTRVIIDVANNTPFYANMADLDSKARTFVEALILLVTTNVKDMDARNYSNAPYTVQRRMHVVITVRAKPEFQYMENGQPQGIDPKKVAAFNAANPDATFDDIWLLTLEKAVCPAKLSSAAGYTPIIHEGKPLVDVPFRTAVQFLIKDFELHRSAQDNIIYRMEQRNKDIRCCGVDGCNQIAGWCDAHPNQNVAATVLAKEANEVEEEDTRDGLTKASVNFLQWVCKMLTPKVEEKKEKLDKQFGEEIVNSIQKSGNIVSSRLAKDLFGFGASVEGVASLALLTSARAFARHWDWMSVVPTPWLDTPIFEKSLMAINYRSLRRSYILRTVGLWGSNALCMYRFRHLPRYPYCFLGALVGTSCLLLQKRMVEIVKNVYRKELVSRNTISPTLQQFRDQHVNDICKACAVVGALYAISRIYKAWKCAAPQGSLEPKTFEDVAKRDAERDIWTSVVPRALPTNPSAANTTSEQLMGLVEKNLVYGSVYVGDKTLRVNGLFLKSNVVVVPHHYFEAEVLDVTFRKCNPLASGGKFHTRLSLAQSVRLPNSDLRICYSDTGGSFKDLTRFLPVDEPGQIEFALKWRNMEGDITNASGMATCQNTSNGVCTFKGLYYNSLTIDTFQGMCGATLISKRRAILLGVHLGGQSGTPRGCAGLLPYLEVMKAVDELKKVEGVLVTGSAEKFEAQVLGVNIITGKELHPKSPLNYMPKNSQVEFYGNCPGQSVFRSNVKVTPISEHVTDVMDFPNVFRPPVVEPQWFGWQECLQNLAVPALPYDPKLLMMAVKDYKEDMLPIFRSHLWKDARPLTDHENLCGIPGKKFVDSIKLNTSVGYPLGGAKRRFVTELPPTEDAPNNRVFDDTITNEIERCLELYKKGERAYVIARACKKDEVLSKEKCRVFYGNGIALTFLVRRYFLPILRVMQFNPKTAECAVGINSHGPEWQELHEHIFTFGEDRLIGGDYGKYDQKLPAQLILASLRIMIDFARECNYSEEDTCVMEAMAGDIVYAIIAYNGDLIGLTEGTHISGNSLTVIINGISGSLNLRCYFYKFNPAVSFEERKKFRDHVKLITYGDDNIGSVSKEINNFTIKGASKFLKGYGQTYTMPDKESKLLDFLPPDQFEFLKRKSVYHEALGVHLGALVDKSCFKMLHCFIREKSAPLSEGHACALNIDTALREWFNHGPEVYETRRVQLTEVAKRAGIDYMCAELNVTYEARVVEWKNKHLYGGVNTNPTVVMEVFSPL